MSSYIRDFSMHVPVLLQEVINGLTLKPNDHCIDATLGAGGHAAAILRATDPFGVVIGFDRDAEACVHTAKTLQKFGDRLIPIHDSYTHLTKYRDIIDSLQPIVGVLADLGLSSDQLFDANRGFAFSHDGLLDMRFDPRHGVTAADILHSWSEEELRKIFWDYGEDPAATIIARTIVQKRRYSPLKSTNDLLTILSEIPALRGRRHHPATQVFQALRIAVNDELEMLRQFLPDACDVVALGGRIAVISYHSLEDRIVKQFFATESRDCLCPPEIPECRCGHKARVRVITRHPIRPQEEEVQRNRRSRSARLRIAERIR